MKFHRPLCEIIIKCLEEIFLRGFLADKVVNFQLKANKKLGSRDRRFVAETVYEIVRWWRLITFLLEQEKKDAKSVWNWLGYYLLRDKVELPSWKEWDSIRNLRWPTERQINDLPRAIRESIPDWLDELGSMELGNRWSSVLHALNKPAEVIIRANRLKVEPERLIEILKAEEISVKIINNDALLLENRKNLFSSRAYQEGLFEIQDWSSQQVASLLDPKPGERVIDACAGAGGKTLHLAALMQNKGRIIALDIHAKKLDELKRRARRASVSNVEVRPIESNKTIKRLEKAAERLLLDIPCSGLGVLRRKPDSKWKLTLEKIAELRAIQIQILRDYTAMSKIGGTIVYSTCSILPSENQKNVTEFLEEVVGRFELLRDRTFYPDEVGFDGFYVALLRRIK